MSSRRLFLASALLLAGLAAASALVEPAPVAAASRGYTARPCGIDLDMNGRVCEAGTDESRLCNGALNGKPAEFDEVYVDCGAEEQGKGTFESPYADVDSALASLDGLANGNGADVLCLAGTCGSARARFPIDIATNGVASTVTKAPSYPESFPFEFADRPLYLLGTDGDRDGSYPPYDKDDVAVIDGEDADSYAFKIDGRYVRLAHLSVEDFSNACEDGDYGDSKSRGGFLDLADDAGWIDVHDVEARRINGCMANHGGLRFLNVWYKRLRYVSIRNVLNEDAGAYITARGGGAASWPEYTLAGLRIQNMTGLCRGCPGTEGACSSASKRKCSVDDLAGAFDRVEFLSNVFDSRGDRWHNSRSTGIAFQSCMQNVVARNNEVEGFLFGISGNTQAASGAKNGYCATMKLPMQNLVIEDNIVRINEGRFHHDQDKLFFGVGTDTTKEDAGNPHTWVKQAAIRNNVVQCIGPHGKAYAGVHYVSGVNGVPAETLAGGIARIEHNTVRGCSNLRNGAVVVNDRTSNAGLGSRTSTTKAHNVANVVLRNNFVAEMKRGVNVAVSPGHGLRTLGETDGNVWDSDAAFVWKKERAVGLAEWRKLSASDGNARFCDVGAEYFVPETAGRIALGGGCASRVPCLDGAGLDGERRPRVEPCHAGAYEEPGPAGGLP